LSIWSCWSRWSYRTWLADVAASNNLDRWIGDSHQAKINHWIDLHERLWTNALDLDGEVRDG
jgi:hypothetical protein